MTPAGYMAKHVATHPDWLKTDRVVDVYSVSNCVSGDFADYIKCWKHNGYWLFDSPETIRKVAEESSVDLEDTKLFYYEVHELEYDAATKSWTPFAPEQSLKTQVLAPETKVLEGYDIATFLSARVRNVPRCHAIR